MTTPKKTDKRPTREDRALAALRKLGGQARTAQIAKESGLNANAVGASLSKAIARGDVVSCTVKTGNGHCIEYRIGSGTPDTFRPLNTGRRVTFGNRPASGQAPVLPAAPSVVKPFMDESKPAKPAKTIRRAVAMGGNDSTGIWLEIYSDASLRIVKDGNVSLALNPDQVLALGDFLHATEGLWRP